MNPKILAISGFKNSGKTTLITKLIPRLSELGIKVATIKHDGHDFDADTVGTDSYRHMEAGAVGTAIFSNNKYMIINKIEVDETQLFAAFQSVDLILIEGMKYSDYPKIEIVKGESKPICENVLAIVSDIDDNPYIHRDNINCILNVICSYLEKEEIYE